MCTWARHGETEWSKTGQHTGLTDLPLTGDGERNALLLGERLRELEISRVYASLLRRARRTCELCGFSSRAEIDPDLVEWDYGEYEGKTGAEIRVRHPGWDVFVDGCPGGESPQQVASRADRVVRQLRTHSENTLVFTSGHFHPGSRGPLGRLGPGTAGPQVPAGYREPQRASATTAISLVPSSRSGTSVPSRRDRLTETVARRRRVLLRSTGGRAVPLVVHVVEVFHLLGQDSQDAAGPLLKRPGS